MIIIKSIISNYFSKKTISIATCLVFLFYLGLLISVEAMNFFGFIILAGINQSQFYLQCFFLCMGYYYFRLSMDRNLDETLVAISGGIPVYRSYLLAWQLFVAGAFHLTVLISLVSGAFVAGNQAYFISWLWKPYMINAVLPTLIVILLAYYLAFNVSRLTAYGLIITFLLLISPFAETIVWATKPAGFPIDQVVRAVRWPFQILYQNANWLPDYQYGLQTELSRILVQVAWLVLLISLGPILTIVKNRQKTRLPILLAAVTISFGILIISYQPASLYRLNDSWDGVRSDLTYYDAGSSLTDLSLKRMADPGFKIEEYHLKVFLNLDLDVEAVLLLRADTPM